MAWPLILIGGALAGGLAWLVRVRVRGQILTPLFTKPLPPALDPVLSPSAVSMPPPTMTQADLITASGNIGAVRILADPANMVPVDFNGETWLVSPSYIGPAGIGAAASLAQSLGLSLPSPGLVDAIWRAADLKLTPPIRNSDGTPKTMSSPAVYEAQRARIEALIAGRPFRLLAGTHKDIVMGDAQSASSAGGEGLKVGKVGLYGWHSEVPVPGIKLHAPVTGGPGRVIQQPFGGHGLDWEDYSQGLRLVRRA